MKKLDIEPMLKALRKHSPEILTGIGIAGMLTTVVLAVKATPKALMLIEDEKRELNAQIREMYMEHKIEEPMKIEKLSPLDTVKVSWKCYAPAAITGIASIACLVGSTSISLRKTAVITTAYAVAESTLHEYKDKVIESIGEKEEEKIRDLIAKDKIEKNPIEKNEIVKTKNGTTLCYDPFSGRYFESDIETIRKVINQMNHAMLFESYVSLNDFYDYLDLNPTKVGEILGWHVDHGLIELKFTSQLTSDNRPCLVIDFDKPPAYDFDKWL